jgi:hypothetical protein
MIIKNYIITVAAIVQNVSYSFACLKMLYVCDVTFVAVVVLSSAKVVLK